MGTVVGHDVAGLNSQAIAEHNDRPGNVSEIAEPASMRDLSNGQMAALAPRSAAPERLPPTVQDVVGATRQRENQTAYRGGFAAPLRPRQFRG